MPDLEIIEGMTKFPVDRHSIYAKVSVNKKTPRNNK